VPFSSGSAPDCGEGREARKPSRSPYSGLRTSHTSGSKLATARGLVPRGRRPPHVGSGGSPAVSVGPGPTCQRRLAWASGRPTASASDSRHRRTRSSARVDDHCSEAEPGALSRAVPPPGRTRWSRLRARDRVPRRSRIRREASTIGRPTCSLVSTAHQGTWPGGTPGSCSSTETFPARSRTSRRPTGRTSCSAAAFAWRRTCLSGLIDELGLVVAPVAWARVIRSSPRCTPAEVATSGGLNRSPSVPCSQAGRHSAERKRPGQSSGSCTASPGLTSPDS
jgi:hypothetical protein